MSVQCLQAEKVALERINAALEANQPARSVSLSPEEAALVKALNLLTAKPMIYAANVAESDLADQGASSPHVQAMRERAAQEGSSLVVCSAQVIFLMLSSSCCVRRPLPLADQGASSPHVQAMRERAA